MYKFQSECLRRPMAQLKSRQREQILPYSTFCSIQTSRGLYEAHPHWGGQSALFSLLIEMLIHLEAPSQVHPK